MHPKYIITSLQMEGNMILKSFTIITASFCTTITITFTIIMIFLEKIISVLQPSIQTILRL